MFFIRCPEPALAIANNFANRWWNDCLKTMPNLCSKKHALQMGNWCTFDRGNLTGTGAVVEQYTACFVCNVWKQSSLAYNTCPSFYIYLLYMICYCSIQAQSTALATPRAMVCWSCFQQPLAMLKCSMPQWAGGRQAPCSLVLMPSTSPLGPGTCQQWPTWGDVPWSYCQPSRLVPGTHQQWLVRWWDSVLHALYAMFENKVPWHTIHVLHSTYIYCTW